jgi:hypothetical protein
MLQLPNLDDRRWADLVDDARALIPLYAPAWTDHNAHDPGITVIELLASIAELDVYQLNQISDRHLRKFLQLVGVEPHPPRAARGAVTFRLAPTAARWRLPEGVELVDLDDPAQPVRLRTLAALDVLPVQIAAVLVGSGDRLVDVSAAYLGTGVAPAPPPPIVRADGAADQALYLGFQSAAWPGAGAQLSLYLAFDAPDTGLEARQRLIVDRRRAREACPDPRRRCQPCEPGAAAESSAAEPDATATDKLPPHHSAVTAWEYWDGARWAPVAAADDTRSFTLDGAVTLTVPAGWVARALDGVPEVLFYARARLVSGELDVPPVLRAVAVNSVEAEQAHAVWQTWTIAPEATITGTAPAPGAAIGVRFEVGDDGRIRTLAFVDAEPRTILLAFDRPSGKPGGEGRLTLEAVSPGRGSGSPSLRIVLTDPPLVASTLCVQSLEGPVARAWQRQADFAASRRADAHFVVDAERGLVDFGDGEQGRAVPAGGRILAAYHATLAQAGELPRHASLALENSPHNRALVADLGQAQQDIAAAVGPVPLAGGRAMETLAHAIGRAIDGRETTPRAVTLADYERLARQTPGTRVARASARANVRPGLGCVTASGHVVVVIVPDSGAARPMPSPGLRRAVARYLSGLRIIGTRVEVIGPEYVAVTVRATVAALPRVDQADVRVRAIAALDRFLDPMHGGPDGTGWPFGRDVYRSEVLEILDRTAGVDRVESLALVVEGCDGQCGNVCLPANGLVAVGAHLIEVV